MTSVPKDVMRHHNKRGRLEPIRRMLAFGVKQKARYPSATPLSLEANPPGIFDRAALDAALKFKYKPRVINGEPMEVAGIQNRITFEMDN